MKTTPKTRVCPRCEDRFTTEGPGNHMYCLACRERTCEGCGKAWKPRKPSTPETFCGRCRHLRATEQSRRPRDYEYRAIKRWRERVAQDHDYRCAECGSEDQLQAHHVVPRGKGGKNTAENGVLLCADCHGGRHTLAATAALDDELVERIAKRVVDLLRDAQQHDF